MVSIYDMKKEILVSLIIIISLLQLTSAIEIIAHRGGKYWEDNDFSYIEDSINPGATIIELDITQLNNGYIIKH